MNFVFCNVQIILLLLVAWAAFITAAGPPYWVSGIAWARKAPQPAESAEKRTQA
jgi:hypothetical protein